MEKTYRESRLTIVGLLFSLFVLFLFVKIFLAAIESEQIVFIAMMLVVCLTWLKVIYNSLNNIFKKIVVKDNGIFITKFGKVTELRWETIQEFGRIEKKRLLQGAGEDNWIYYVIGRGSEKSNIKLGDSNFNGMDEIVSTILKKAKSAKFMTKKNISKFPGVKKFEEVSWEV